MGGSPSGGSLLMTGPRANNTPNPQGRCGAGRRGERGPGVLMLMTLEMLDWRQHKGWRYSKDACCL